MGYLLAVSDLTHQDALSHLSAAETRLSEVLARPKRIALGCIVVLTGLGWFALALMISGRKEGIILISLVSMTVGFAPVLLLEYPKDSRSD